MLKTLHGRLSAVLLALLCVTTVLYVPLTLLSTQRYLQEADQKLNRTLATHIAEHLAARNLLRKDARSRAQAIAEIKRLMVINPSVEVYLVDISGGVLAYSAAPEKVRMEHIDTRPLQRFINGTNPAPMLGDDPLHPGKRKIFSVSSIPVSNHAGKGQIEGYVYIILGGEEYDSVAQLVQRSYILRLALMQMVGILLFFLLTGLLLFRSLTRPLRLLTAAMEVFQRQITSETRAERHAVSPALEPAQGDEISRLDRIFRHMAAQVEKQVQMLRKADRDRRELVSNVSHDLRTPLAALQGYLETLQIKEGQLSADEQRHYLAIAVKHSERLNSLIAELFELAKLEAYEMKAHPEPFSLGELVQDVAQKFQLAAERNRLKLETDFSSDLRFVYADIGLIERVLENLLDNAVRHTPKGGEITLTLIPKLAQVEVQVRDTGRGIHQEDLPYIFERYYHAANTAEEQSEMSGGAGLGLAIARRILELHESAIEVRSTSESGTTFAFSLPLAPSQGSG